MANETTTSTADDAVNSSYIVPLMQAAARNSLVAVPLCWIQDMSGKNAKVADFVIPDADAVSDITEGTAMSNTSFSTSRVQVTMGQVGIHREVTDYLRETSVFDIEAYLTSEDGPAAIAQEMDTDVTATYANASVSVSDSGNNADYSDFLELIALHATGLGGPGIAFVGHPRQVSDIRNSALASQAAIFANASAGATTLQMGQRAAQGYVGDLLGVPMYQTTVCATANAGADVVGALLSAGSSGGGSDRTAATGFAYLWMAKVKQMPSTENTSEKYGITACYGTAEVCDRSIIKLVTDA